MSIKNVQVRIESDLVRWFDTSFPMYGAKQWFFEGCLARLRELVESGEANSPGELLDQTVREVTSEINGGQ